MGTKERRERAKDATRQKILDAARELFASEGYEAVSMRRIADAIEYSPTAIYIYFKDKADLMKELCHMDYEAFTSRAQQFADVANPIERIRLLARSYIQFAIEHPNHFRLMFMTKPMPEMVQMDEEEMRERGRGDPTRDGYAFLMQCVQQAIAQGWVREDLRRDPELVAQMLWAGGHGVASLQVTRLENEPWFTWKGADALGEATLLAVLRGILRDESILERNGSATSIGTKAVPDGRNDT
ncbi:MAG: TetR/AcrR family transcriptional regulator [Phycisphaerae bacterium]|jgi:AcrR family transcriptional regulator|nr:TetR/AcrR family transcriptional regulator [Phycisphaerae bacterium]